MDRQHVANQYALAKLLGYQDSIVKFADEYKKMRSAALDELNASVPVTYAKAEPTMNPMHMGH